MIRKCIALFLLSASGFACSFFPPVYKVSRSFSVHVKNDIGPVAGLKLRVSRFKIEDFERATEEQQRAEDPAKFEEIIAESVTDSTGTARFELDRTGAFTLAPDHPASRLDWVELEVANDAPVTEIGIQWPATAILKTALVRGRLTKGLMSSRSLPLNNNALSLRTLVDYKEIASTTTTDNGTFEFSRIPPGLYFLRIVPTNSKTDDFYKPEGNIAIDVANDAGRDSLAISTVNSSCGLSYDLEENKGRYKPVACFKGGKSVPCEY